MLRLIAILALTLAVAGGTAQAQGASGGNASPKAARGVTASFKAQVRAAEARTARQGKPILLTAEQRATLMRARAAKQR